LVFPLRFVRASVASAGIAPARRPKALFQQR
jgi:hypothetical protein